MSEVQDMLGPLRAKHSNSERPCVWFAGQWQTFCYSSSGFHGDKCPGFRLLGFDTV